MGLTNVLIGIDPNKIEVWKAGLEEHYEIHPRANPYFIGQDWLRYKHDPQHQQGKRHSEQGDWKDEYWDGTPNQAYHFWFSSAVVYYDSYFMASLANNAHDLYYLEWICGDDLEKLSFIQINDESITNYTNETSEQDYKLSQKGMQFGNYAWWFGSWSFFKPGNWIRSNLSSSEK